MAGDGGARSRFEKVVESLGDSVNVEFIGSVNDVKKYLRSAQVFLLLFGTEGMSIALLEHCLATKRSNRGGEC